MLKEKENTYFIADNKLNSKHNVAVHSQLLMQQPQTNAWDYYVQTSKCLSYLKSLFCNCKNIQ